MHKEGSSILKAIDTQIELLENLNRRLEELQDWSVKFPNHTQEVRKLYDEGVAFGNDVRKLVESSSQNLNYLLAQYQGFIRKYEVLWKSIQDE